MIKFYYLFAITAVCSAQAYYLLDHDYVRTPLGDAIDRTSLKLLKEIYTTGEDKNVVASPLGIMLLLSLYLTGADEGSREEITKFLGGTDSNQIVSSYSGLSRHFSEMSPDFITIANKIYVNNSYTLNEWFASNASMYKSEVDTIDFRDIKKAADLINQWADEKSRGHIKSPVSENTIDPDAAAALFNVIFFQGHWHVPFKATETEDKDFHVDSKTTVKKPTMRLLQSLYYTDNRELGARMVELPYKEDGFRMVIILPDKLEGLPSVLQKASEEGLLEAVFRLQPTVIDVHLEIPKFEVRSALDLKDILRKVEVLKIFNEPAPGVVQEDGVVVSKVVQEAFIKVDEEGATAGVFTGVLMSYNSADNKIPRSLEFKVDHPFAYLILYQDKIIFVGTYTH